MTTLAQASALFTNAGLAAAGAAAVAIPIAIHLLTRLRRKRQPWAAMRFLLEAYRRQKRRLQLEQLILLLVRCAILVVLGLALAGPLLGLARGAAGGGRLVCIVIDDALSTQASPDGAHPRLDQVKRDALAVIAGLGRADQVAVWSAARPHKALVVPPTLDHEEARRAIESMPPRFSRADWPAALGSVRDALQQARAERGRAYVVMLGDFAAGALDLERPPSAELAGLGKQAKLLVARPMPDLPNIQIAALRPRRYLVLPGVHGTASIPVEVRLRRFAPQRADPVSGVELALLADGGAGALRTRSSEYRWSPGQSEAVVNLDIDVPAELLGPPAIGAGGASEPAPRALTLRATLDPGSAGDTLAADNTRLAVVELRHRLNVGLVDDLTSAAAAGEANGDLSPRDWLRLGLLSGTPGRGAPGFSATGFQNGGGPIRIEELAVAALEPAALHGLDAAMVLRPDLVAPDGWKALRSLAERGGLVWVFVPPSDAPTAWTGALREHFGVEWQLGLERLAHPSATPEQDDTWPVASETPAPEPLQLLATDWPLLLRRVGVRQRIDLAVRDPEQVWMRLETPQGDAPPDGATPPAGEAAIGGALLAAAPVGDGRVMLLATALDLGWTNLPAKPLFVPLLHETLRGVLGSTADAVRMNGVVAGDQPALSPRWAGVGTLTLSDAGADAAVFVRREPAERGGGMTLAAPVERPGLYRPRGEAGSADDPARAAQRLAVNVDADAGDTRALDAGALGGWLRGLGDWDWLDASIGVPVAAAPPRGNWGWPLLWATLVLLLLETALAKWFSHAKV